MTVPTVGGQTWQTRMGEREARGRAEQRLLGLDLHWLQGDGWAGATRASAGKPQGPEELLLAQGPPAWAAHPEEAAPAHSNPQQEDEEGNRETRAQQHQSPRCPAPGPAETRATRPSTTSSSRQAAEWNVLWGDLKSSGKLDV